PPSKMTSPSTNLSSLIDDSLHYHESVVIRTLFAINFVGSMTGIIAISSLLKNGIWRKLAKHRNLLVSLASHCLWTAVMCIGVLINTSAQLCRYFTFSLPADLLISGWECFLRISLFATALNGVIFSLVVTAVERLIGTVIHKSYIGNSIKICALLITLQVCVPIAMTLSMGIDYGLTESFSFCTVQTTRNKHIHEVLIVFFFIFVILSLVLFHSMNYGNRRLLGSLHKTSLTQRYQVKENLRMLFLLSPLFDCHSLITLPLLLVFTFLPKLWSSYKPRDYAINEEIFHVMYLHGLALPLFLLLRNTLQRRYAGRYREHADLTERRVTDLYLSSTQKAW
ncbi:hypothetical protein PMAYCL1PPCAC_23209, partial [Pristionchus mayeri]